MNSIDDRFKQLKREGKKAFIVYLTCGYPDLPTTKKLILEMAKIGVDIIELGVPFSDPLADGPVIQQSSQEALKKGISLSRILSLAREVRIHSDIPLVLMGYYNSISAYGVKEFARDAKRSGIDGLIVPDLPPEEGKELKKEMDRAGLDIIFLVAPTSAPERIRGIAKESRGFIYYVSLTGVTGIRKKIPEGIREGISRLRRFTSKPVCIGFGVSSREQVKIMKNMADGLIVGSAIIRTMEKNKHKNLIPETISFTEELLTACKS